MALEVCDHVTIDQMSVTKMERCDLKTSGGGGETMSIKLDDV